MRAGSIVAGRFEIAELAGHGGMGSVYRAKDRLTGETVALKMLRGRDPLGEQRLAREARILADLSHPSIVEHVAHGVTAGGTFYLAMEWLAGVPLTKRLAGGPLPRDEAIELAWHLADALGAAHRRGIVHRDIKPSNIVMGARPSGSTVTLLDFGVAHLRASAEELTATGALLGTPGYMAPEQARGERDIDARADVFALGCVLFEALSGRRPFEGDDLMTVLIQIAGEDAPRLREVVPSVDPLLDDLVARMLAQRPSDRPAHGGAVRDALPRVQIRVPPEAIEAPPLSMSERRWVSAALIRPSTPAGERAWEALSAAVARHGARLDVRADGSAIAAAAMAGPSEGAPDAATDLAVRAARCALSARDLLPEASVAIVTGRGDRRGSVDPLLERAAALLTGPGIRADEASRYLLLSRFDLDKDGVLEGERDDEAETRLLLQRPAELVGRSRELDLLSAMFDESRRRREARAAVVLGAPGIGKSRLRQELCARLARLPSPPRVWIARADDVSAGSPFGMISRALRREAAIVDGEPLDAQRSKLSSRFGSGLPDATRTRTIAFAGELCGVPFFDDTTLELAAARDNPVLMGDHIHRAFEEIVAAELGLSSGDDTHRDGSIRPLVLVLEDIHWGDRPSLDLVRNALRSFRDAPLFVLALGRPEATSMFPALFAERDAQTAPASGPASGALSEIGGARVIRLGELSPEQSEALVRSVLGDEISDPDLARIVERAGGNAFFLGEIVRSFAEGERRKLPETVLAMVGARIEHLDPGARRVLRAASLFGATFWIEGVRALLGDSVAPAEIDAAIEAGVRRELLVRRRSSRLAGQTEIAFRHALVRDAAAAMVPEEALAPAHLRIAEWLERAGEHDIVTLAEHFERGGDRTRASDAYRRAAVQALEGNDFTATIERADRAIRAGAEGQTRGFLRRLQAEAHGWLDEHAQARAHGREAMQLLPCGSPVWCAAAVEVVRATAGGMEHDELLTTAAEIGTLDPGAPRPHHVSSAARAATYLYGTDHRAEADWLLDHAERLARYPDAIDPGALAWLHHARSWRALFESDPVGSLHAEELALQSFERTGDARNASYIRIGLAHAYREVGAHDRAATILREVLPIAERMGLPHVLLGTKYTLSTVLGRAGAHVEAERFVREALLGFEAEKDIRMIGVCRAELARILTTSGDLARAERTAREACRLLEGLPATQVYALAILAYVRLQAGKPAGALDAATAAMRILDEVGTIQEGDVLVRLAFAEALYANSSPDAEQALTAARDHLLARGARIKDVALRLSFLQQIPENARTLALSRARLPPAPDDLED